MNSTCSTVCIARLRPVQRSIRRQLSVSPSNAAAGKSEAAGLLVSAAAGAESLTAVVELRLLRLSLEADPARLYGGSWRLVLRLQPGAVDAVEWRAARNLFLVFAAAEKPLAKSLMLAEGSALNETMELSTTVHESSFTDSDGKPLTRSQLLQLVAEAKHVSLPVSLTPGLVSVTVVDATAEVAVDARDDDSNSSLVAGVERCRCMRNAIGLRQILRSAEAAMLAAAAAFVLIVLLLCCVCRLCCEPARVCAAVGLRRRRPKSNCSQLDADA